MSIIDIISHACGILGIIAAFAAFQCKSHFNVMLFRAANGIFFAVQYLLLGAWTGLVLNSIGVIRDLIFGVVVKKKKSTLPYIIVFGIITAISGFITADGKAAVFIVCAKVVSTIAYGMTSTGLIRCLGMPTHTGWLVYNALIGSYEGAICEGMTVLSIVIGLIRIDLMGLIKRKRMSVAEKEAAPELSVARN